MREEDFIFKNPENKKLDNGFVKVKSPSNIALVKYWGKSEPQIPKNASISFTLNNCFTSTILEYTKKENASKKSNIKVIFEGEEKEAFKPKIEQFLERILIYVPFISDYDYIIKTENSFPHSSGIASSASGMSALALGIMSLEKKLNPGISEEYLLSKSSFLSRLGSGSAARSIEGPLIVWGKHPKIKNSSDLYGTVFPFKIHPIFEKYQDTILLVDQGEKQISSTVGHNLMHKHPYAENRFAQANENLDKLTEVLITGDIKEFINIVESEALALHAMMMTSNPYFILMKPNTLKIINKIWEFRKRTHLNICFTLDAGANVHVLFPKGEKREIDTFISNELVSFCQNNKYICDSLGEGAEIVI
jgi:diphosphomevalonate decarboxylase